MKKNNITKWVYWFLFAVAVIAVYKTLDNLNNITNWIKNLLNVLMPFIMGIIIAYLFYLPSRKLENTLKKQKKSKIIAQKSRLISVIIVYLIAIILIVLLIQFVVPNVIQSIMDLAGNLQNYYNNTVQTLNEMPEGNILNSDISKEILKAFANIDLKQFINIDKLGEYAKGAINAATGIFDFFVAMIVSIYILLERREILKFMKKLIYAIFGKKLSEKIGRYFNRSNEIFFRFLASQFLDAIIVAILASIALTILNVKYSVLLGILIGISNLIPYFGAIVGVGASIIITIFTGGISKALIMAVVIIILQQIDANIINPKIVGNSLKISPLLVILGVSVGGAYFGVLGMFLAVPIIAILKLFITDYIEYKNIQRKRINEE